MKIHFFEMDAFVSDQVVLNSSLTASIESIATGVYGRLYASMAWWRKAFIFTGNLYRRLCIEGGGGILVISVTLS